MRRNHAARLCLSFYGSTFVWKATDWTDLHVIREVFIEEEYSQRHCSAPTTILDLGSHRGASLIYFALRFPRASVYGIEPDPDSFALLCENMRPFHHVRLLNVAVAGESGVRRLYRRAHSSWETSLTPTAASMTVLEVPALPLDDICDQLGLTEIDLLKLDVEGAEWEALAASTRLPRIRTIIGELHLGPTTRGVDDFAKLLAGFRCHFAAHGDCRYGFSATRLDA